MTEDIVEDQDQLDALPLGSVVIDSYRQELNGDVYRSHLTNGRVRWFQAGPQGVFTTVCFPAKVLHRTDLPNKAELLKARLIDP